VTDQKAETAEAPQPHHNSHDTAKLAVIVGALGVVFGDIGTSPIYALQTVFNPEDPHPVPLSDQNVYGVVSLIFWSVMIIVTVRYCQRSRDSRRWSRRWASTWSRSPR